MGGGPGDITDYLLALAIALVIVASLFAIGAIAGLAQLSRFQ